MDVATAQVLRGFLSLDRDQRDELVAWMNNVIEGRITRSYALTESERIYKVQTGPVGHVCGCCGR